jgi:hypothetical protein
MPSVETNRKPTGNQQETNRKPTGNQQETNRKPTGNQQETNRKPTGNQTNRKPTNGALTYSPDEFRTSSPSRTITTNLETACQPVWLWSPLLAASRHFPHIRIPVTA